MDFDMGAIIILSVVIKTIFLHTLSTFENSCNATMCMFACAAFERIQT